MNTGGTHHARPAAAIVTAALALTLTACGTSNDTATPASSTPAASSSAPPSTTAPPTPTPAVAQTYGTVTDLRDALVAAGMSCTQWDPNNRVKKAAQSGDCDDDTVLSTYTSEDDRDEIVEFLKATGGASLLVGPNWVVNSPDAADWQPMVGGAVVTT